MANFIVTTELCEEDRRRVDDLLYFLARTCTALENSGTPFEAPAAQPQIEPQPEPEAPAAPQEPDPKPTKDWKTVKLADVQKKVVDLSTAGKKDAVKAIVQKYAAKVSAIPEDKLLEVMEQLTALEG